MSATCRPVLRVLLRTTQLASALVLAVCGPAQAITLINNGLAPPNPANVIPGTNSYDYSDDILVRNVGCTGTGDCASAGASTEVVIESPGAPGGGEGRFSVFDTSTISMTGGGGTHIWGYDSSSIVMSGGWLQGGIDAYDNAVVELSGDASPQFLGIYDDAVVSMRDDVVSAAILTSGSSFLSISSPGAAHLDTHESSAVVIDGGMTDAVIRAHGASLIEFIGSDFMVDGVPVGYGDLGAMTGILTGTLASGDVISGPGSIQFWQGGGEYTGIIRLLAVPEPSTALLLGMGLLGLTMRRPGN